MYHFKAHTISNKLVSKVSAQKKGGKSYDSSNMCSNFCGLRSSPPWLILCADNNLVDCVRAINLALIPQVKLFKQSKGACVDRTKQMFNN